MANRKLGVERTLNFSDGLYVLEEEEFLELSKISPFFNAFHSFEQSGCIDLQDFTIKQFFKVREFLETGDLSSITTDNVEEMTELVRYFGPLSLLEKITVSYQDLYILTDEDQKIREEEREVFLSTMDGKNVDEKYLKKPSYFSKNSLGVSIVNYGKKVGYPIVYEKHKGTYNLDFDICEHDLKNFKGFDWTNVILAGGAVFRKVFGNKCYGGDYDLFIITQDEKVAKEKIRYIHSFLKKKGGMWGLFAIE